MSDEMVRILSEFAENPVDASKFGAAVDVHLRERDAAGVVSVFTTRAAHMDGRLSAGHWRACVDTLERLLNAVSEPSERARVLMTSAEVWEERLRRPDQALLQYQAASRVDRQADEAFAQIRRIQGEQGNWLMVARSFQRQLQVERPDSARVALLIEAANVYRRRLGDAASADALLREARALDAEAVEAAGDGAQERRGWRSRLERLEAGLYGTKGAARAEKLIAIAEIWVDESAEAASAEPYLEEALRIAPMDPKGLQLRARYQARTGDGAGAEATLRTVVGSEAPPEARAEAMVSLAGLLGKRERWREVDAWVERALASAPRSESVLDFAIAHYTRMEDWEALASALERALAARVRPGSAARIHLALGELYWRKLHDMERAERYFRRVRLAERRNPTMLEFYVAYHTEAGDWGRALTSLRAVRDAQTEEAARLAVTERMAALALEKLHSPDRAVDMWTAARAEFPDSPKVRARLSELLRSTGKWNRLLELWKSELAALPTDARDERISLLMQMAEVYREHFDLPVLEGNAYAAILELDPTHEAAGRALAERYERSERWADLVTLLRRRVARAPADEAASLWRKIGALERDRVQNRRSAAQAFERVLELVPGDAESFAALRELYAERPEDLFRVRRAELEWLPSEELAEGLQVLLASPGAALASAEERLALHRRLVEATDRAPAAVGGYEDALRESHAWPELIEAMELRLSLASSPSPEDLRTLARLRGKYAPDAEREQALWRAVLTAEPGDSEAAEALSAVLIRAGSWGELEVLAGELDDWDVVIVPLRAAAEEGGDSSLFARLARVLAERLDDRVGQVAMLERALTLNPSDVAAGRALETAYGLAGNPTGRARVLASLLESAPEAERRDLRMSLAAVLLDDLDRAADAFAVLEPVFAEDASDAGARDRLTRAAAASGKAQEWLARLKREGARMAASPARIGMFYAIAAVAEEHAGSPLEAADYLERIRSEASSAELRRRLARIYERSENWARLSSVVEESLEHAEGEERLDLLFLSAFLRARVDAEEPVLPVEVLRSSGADLEHTRLRRLRERLEGESCWAALADVAAAEASAARGAAEVRTARLAEAKALHALEREEGALALRRLCESSPASEEALVAADLLMTIQEGVPADGKAAQAVYVAHERWADAVAALEHQLAAGAERDPTLREMARLRETALDTPGSALDALLRLGVSTEDDLRASERLARRSGRLADVVDAWSSRDDAPHLRAAARVLEVDLEQADAARALWHRAYDADPTSSEAEAALERLNRALAMDEELADHLIASVESARPAERGARLREAGELLAEQQGRYTEAIPLFERALEEDPRDLGAYAGLERLYRDIGDTDSLVDLLRRKVAAFGDRADVQAAAFRALGDTIRGSGGELKASLDAYRQALDIAPTERTTLGVVAGLASEPGLLDAAKRREVSAWVTRGLHQLGDSAGLLGFLERRLGVESGAEALALHREAARIAELELGDSAQAFHHWSTVIALDDADLEAVNHYVKLGGLVGALVEVVAGLEGLLHRDVGPRREIRERLVQAYLDLGEREDAIRHLEAAVREDDRDLAALNQLETLYRETGAAEDLAAILLARSRSLDREAARAALREAAQIFTEVVGDAHRAADCLWRLQRLEPENMELLKRLERLLERLERWEELTSVLAALARNAVGVEAADQRLRRALVLDKGLGDTTRAIAAYRSVLEIRTDDRVSLERLEVLYGQLGMAHERAAVLAIRIPTLPSDERTAARLRLARLKAMELEDVEGGVGTLREVLAADPSNADARALLEELAQAQGAVDVAIDALVEFYGRSGDFADAVAVLGRAAAEAPRAGRVALLMRAAELQEHSLSDLDGAFASALQAIEASRAQADTVALGKRLALARGGWAALATSLSTAADSVPDPGRQAELLLKVGDIYQSQLHRHADAEEAYQKVLRTDPMNVEALRALDRMYEASGRSGMRSTRDTPVEAGSAATRRVHMLHRSTLLHADEGDDLDATVERYEQILRVDPTDATALARLRTLLRRQEAWARLEIHLERMVELQLEPLGRVPLLLELASLQAGVRGTPRLAVGPLAEALRLDPTNLQARRLAESLAAQYEEAPAGMLPLMLELASLYRRHAEWEALEDTLERLASSASAEGASAYWAELAEVREEHLGDGQGALRALGELLRAAPWDTAALDRMEILAEAEWAWAALCDTLREIADGRDISRADRHAILFRLAGIASDWLGDTQRALEAYRELFEGLDDPRRVLPHLLRLTAQAEDWGQAADLLREAAGRMDDPEVAGAMLRQSARISDGLGARAADAAEALDAALTLDDPAREDSLLALVDLLGRTGDWEAQAERLAELMEVASDQALREDARLRLAWLRWERFSDASRSIELVEPLLEGARSSAEAFELLASLVRADLEQEPPSPSAHRAAELLEPLASRRERYDVLIAVYATRARTAEAPSEAAQALVSIADVHQRSGRGARTALMALREALTVQPGDAGILARIRGVVDEIGDGSLLRRTLLTAAGSDYESDERATLVQAAALAAEEQEHDVALAASLHRKLLDARPNDALSSRELERLSTVTGDHLALEGVLRERLAAARTVEARVDALTRLSSVLEDEDESLLGLLDTLVRAERTAVDAVERLERLARAAGDERRLATALWARACGGDRAAVEELAGLQAHSLSDLDAAIASWSEFTNAYGSDLGSARRLAELYRSAERWPELIAALEQVGHATDDVGERLAARKEIARVRSEELDDPVGGLRAYVELLAEAPNDEDAHAGLSALLLNRDTAAGAARALEPIAAAQADHERRLELLDVVLAHTDDPDRQVELALRMADVAARDLGDLERAFEFSAIAIRLQPTNALVLHRMRSYAEGMEELERLALQLEDAAETATQASEVAWLNRLAGDLWKGPLKSDERAIEAYRRAAEARPEDPDAAHLLETSLREADRLDELRQALGERAERVIGREQLEVYCRLASLAEEQGQGELAVEAYVKALRVDARCDVALSGLLRLASEEDASEASRRACADALATADRVEPLREFLALSAAQSSGALAARYYVRLGALAAENGDSPGAAHAYLLALEADPTSREAFAGAARVVISDEDVSRLVDAVERSAGALRDPSELYARLLTAGQLLAARGSSHEDAERLLRDAVLADPEGVEAVDALEAVLLADRRVEDALAALSEFAALAETDETIHRHLRRRIELARELRLPAARVVGMLVEAVSRGVVDERTVGALVATSDDITWQGSAQALRSQLPSQSPATTALLESALAELSAPPRRAPDFAIDHWRSRLAHDPNAYAKLVSTLEKAQRWDALVETLLSGADGAASPSTDDWKQAARVQFERLHDPLASANTYREVLRMAPSDEEARAAFEAQMLELGRLDAVIDLLREELAREDDGAVERHLRIAALIGGGGAESERAMEHIEAALSLDPAEPKAVAALVEHHMAAGRPHDAERVLRVRLQGELSVDRQAALLARLAQVLEESERGDMALDVLREAFALQPTEPEVQGRLAQMLSAREAWDELQTVLYTAAPEMEPGEASALWVELVELAESRLHDPGLALAFAQEAASSGVTSDYIALLLSRALASEDERARTLEAVGAGIGRAERDDRRDDLARLYYLQSLGFARLGEQARAVEAITASFALATGFLPTLLVIARQHARAERWSDVIGLLEPVAQRARQAEALDERADFFALSGLAEHRMGDVSNARAWYAEALEFEPENALALDGLRALRLTEDGV